MQPDEPVATAAFGGPDAGLPLDADGKWRGVIDDPGLSESAASEKALREALDDLWGCIGTAEIDSLQPETVALAQANHELLWHSDESLPWWAIWRRRLEPHRDA